MLQKQQRTDERRQRILVLEDHPDLLELYGRFLGIQYETKLTDNIRDAYDAMEQALSNGSGYDLMITDRYVHGEDADQLVRMLREIGFDRPIIMVSGSGIPDGAYPVNGREVPTSIDYLFMQKPISFLDLTTIVGKVVEA